MKKLLTVTFLMVFVLGLMGGVAGCGGSETLYYDDGAVEYEGGIKHGQLHGQGTMYYPDGKIFYEGEWEAGKPHGQGTMYNEDGTIKHEGEWENGVPAEMAQELERMKDVTTVIEEKSEELKQELEDLERKRERQELDKRKEELQQEQIQEIFEDIRGS